MRLFDKRRLFEVGLLSDHLRYLNFEFSFSSPFHICSLVLSTLRLENVE